MTIGDLITRSIKYHWRTNLAVTLGVATAVATLAGALLVGDSVRVSLRDLALSRLGRTDQVVTSALFFREQLASDLNGCPIIALQGVVTNPENNRRAASVQVYGVDERYWAFQRKSPAEGIRVNRALARELALQPGGSFLLRVEKPSAIPQESLHGRKEDSGKTIRSTAAAIVDDEFSLRAGQGEVLAIFLPLSRLQRELGQPRKVNTILIAGEATVTRTLKQKATLADLGIKVRALPDAGALSLESESAVISDTLTDSAREAAAKLRLYPVFTYLANGIRIGERSIPYSLIVAVDPGLMMISQDAIVLNDWAMQDLGAKPGDLVDLEFYYWEQGGSLSTRHATLRLDHAVPIQGFAADRDLAPDYPGITEANTITEWDPPFPMDLKRIRPKDEDYWNKYRTTPKAFIALATGQKLWSSRFGRATSIRILPGSDSDLDAVLTTFRTALQSRLEPAKLGMAVYSPKASSLASSKGSTDFGEYFTYFSFFLVVSAVLLTGLFFRLGIEQRLSEIGMLRATGWSTAQVRGAMLREGMLLAAAGAIVGLVGAIGYCAFILYGLRTWWSGAVGTNALQLHIGATSLISGAFGGGFIAALSIWWTLRSLGRSSPRALLAGATDPETILAAGKRIRIAAMVALAFAIVLAASAPNALGFFGGGALLLTAALLAISAWLRSRRHGRLTLWNLGSRNASFRPGRSFLCIALIASASFLLVSLDAFRQSDSSAAGQGPHLIAEAQLPLFYDPNTPAGRESLNLTDPGARFDSFRLRPGEDASCLNLYEPRNPRVLGAPASFIDKQAGPWRLLDAEPTDGAIPAIADANSMKYVLHRKVGEPFVINPDSDRPVRVRLVGALQNSVLQSEIIIAEKNFIQAFPSEQGYRFFLIEASEGSEQKVMSNLEENLSDFGFDVSSTADRLASYHKVENTYLSTFQALGALGLLLSTVGLAAVLLRNVLERRRELALLRALGYRQSHLNRIIVTENAFLVLLGLAAGTICALIAILPAASTHGGRLPVTAMLILLVAVPAAALLSSALAVRSVAKSPLLASLRRE